MDIFVLLLVVALVIVGTYHNVAEWDRLNEEELQSNAIWDDFEEFEGDAEQPCPTGQQLEELEEPSWLRNLK